MSIPNTCWAQGTIFHSQKNVKFWGKKLWTFRKNCQLYESFLFLKQIPMEDEDLTTMLETLKKSSTIFSKNLKFGKLILATVNIYGDQVK